MRRATLPSIGVIAAVFLSGGILLGADSEDVALHLAIERNMQVRTFDDRSFEGFSGYKDVTSTVVLIPINKEIINAVIDRKASIEQLDTREKELLRVRHYDRYLHGNSAGFALFVKNGGEFDNQSLARFREFSERTYLHTETEKCSLTHYTRIFDESLNPGWNQGFLYFANFRSAANYSYSVHFSQYHLIAESGGRGPLFSWAFSFDESELNLLALLQKGISEHAIRREYSIVAYDQRGISITDMLTIAGFLMSMVAFLG